MTHRGQENSHMVVLYSLIFIYTDVLWLIIYLFINQNVKGRDRETEKEVNKNIHINNNPNKTENQNTQRNTGNITFYAIISYTDRMS